MASQPDPELWWDSLLRYIDDGKVVPIVGRDLLWLEAEAGPVSIPQRLAQQLAARLRLVDADADGNPIDSSHVPRELVEHLTARLHGSPAAIDGDPVDDVVRAYFSLDYHDHERPYSELSDLIHALDSQPIPPALAKLAQLPFPLLISTTPDEFLFRAVVSAKNDGETVAVIVNSLGSAGDVPRQPTQPRTVVQLFGRANPSTDYAITEVDVLEFVHRFHKDNQPENLLNALRKQHVLLIGSGFSDWLTRFLLRLVRADRLWMTKGLRHFVADREAMRDERLRLFLEHPLTTTSVFQTKNATAFVNELHRRWNGGARRRASPVKLVVGPTQPVADGGVFLSYASEDLAAARQVYNCLVAAGVEVWFDKADFVPGDYWDRIVQNRIEGCFLFVPLLSRHTQVGGGYFYQEWRWAEQRAQRIGYGLKFAFPIVIDDLDVTRARLRLPDLFTRVQCTSAKDGRLADDFVRILLAAYRDFQNAERP